MLRIRSLSVELVLPILAIVGAVNLIVAAAGATYGSRALTQSQHANAQRLAATAQESVAQRMTLGHSDALGPLLRQFAANPDIAAVRILALDGTVRHSAADAERHLVLPSHAVPEGEDETGHGRWLAARPWRSPSAVLHTVTPITNRAECRRCHSSAGDVIGLLDLDLDISRDAAALHGWWRLHGLLGGFEVLLVMAVVAGLLRFTVTRPVRRLRAAIEQVRAGALGVQVDPGGSQEMNELVRGFNAMVLRLRQASEAEESARRLQIECAEHWATVGRMAAGLAHEIRNPLTGVQGALQLLARETPIVAQQSDVLAEAMAALNRIEETLRALLQYARPRPPHFRESDLNAVVTETLALVHPQGKTEGVTIQWNPDPNLPVVIIDPAMIQQVVVNLVINAIDASRARPNALVQVGTEAHEKHVLCRIADNGPGVAQDQEDRIFSAFVTMKCRGTGLGLAISRRLVELHGGRLSLERSGNAGASFVFVLPLRHRDGREEEP